LARALFSDLRSNESMRAPAQRRSGGVNPARRAFRRHSLAQAVFVGGCAPSLSWFCDTGTRRTATGGPTAKGARGEPPLPRLRRPSAQRASSHVSAAGQRNGRHARRARPVRLRVRFAVKQRNAAWQGVLTARRAPLRRRFAAVLVRRLAVHALLRTRAQRASARSPCTGAALEACAPRRLRPQRRRRQAQRTWHTPAAQLPLPAVQRAEPERRGARKRRAGLTMADDRRAACRTSATLSARSEPCGCCCRASRAPRDASRARGVPEKPLANRCAPVLGSPARAPSRFRAAAARRARQLHLRARLVALQPRCAFARRRQGPPPVAPL
jgi:hypothetical protein